MSDKYPSTVFPTTEANWINENARTEGLTLRDHFAGLAMQTCLTQVWAQCQSRKVEVESLYEVAAAAAYEMADAMLKQREK